MADSWKQNMFQWWACMLIYGGAFPIVQLETGKTSPIPLKLVSETRSVTVTSQPIRLFTNFMTLIPSLTFTNCKRIISSICNGCRMPAGNLYPSGHLIPSLYGRAYVPIVEISLPDIVVSFAHFSTRISLLFLDIAYYSHLKRVIFSPYCQMR